MSIKKEKRLCVANWKLSPDTLAEARKEFLAIRRTANDLRKTTVVVCPPFPFIQPLSKILPLGAGKYNLSLGAQNCFYEDSGHYTGEVSPLMLRDLGVRYVILGHSERRMMGETNSDVAKKAMLCLKDGLIPIVVVGETKMDDSGAY